MSNSYFRVFAVLVALLLGGCAAKDLHGYQNTYYSYNVPEHLLEVIKLKLRQNGLTDARITRDSVGRVRLAGSYRNEDEVDRAFVIVQSIVGIKSTSPFYPDQVQEKRWESDARQALAAEAQNRLASRPGRRIAVVIGISKFRDDRHFMPIPGEDDARVVQRAAQQAGFDVVPLLGAQATKANIEGALRRIERELRPQDSLFVYISSHGTKPLPSWEGGDKRRMSIIAWDSGDAAINSETDYYLNLQQTAVSDALVQRLAKKPTRNTRILIDTCFSGEMLRGLPDESGGYIARSNGGAPERAGVSMASWTGPEFVTSKGIRFVNDAIPSSPAKADAPQRTIVDEIGVERAYTIITATSEGEQSLAPPTAVGVFELGGHVLRGSYFTQAFFAYLEQYNGHVEPAFDAARRFTSEKARQVTQGGRTQVPRYFATKLADRNNL
jgi:hypothetical protein